MLLLAVLILLAGCASGGFAAMRLKGVRQATVFENGLIIAAVGFLLTVVAAMLESVRQAFVLADWLHP